MPKTVDPPPVEVNDSSNRSIIYIVILLCIVTIVSYFMYKVYKKLQVLNAVSYTHLTLPTILLV